MQTSLAHPQVLSADLYSTSHILPHGHRIIWHPNGQKESEWATFDRLWELWFSDIKLGKQESFVKSKPTPQGSV